MGGSDVVSEPVAIAHSIWPAAILAPLPAAACKDVPHACINVMPGVEGLNVVPMTASRARLKSRE